MVQDCRELAGELREIYLLSGLDEAQFEAMLAGAQRHTLEPGMVLFRHGDRAERFFWLRDGLIKLTRLSSEGEEKVLELVNRGQTFAEAIMFMDRHVFPVNAEAVDVSEVVSFDSRLFRDMVSSSPGTCMVLLANLSQRLRHIVDEIDRLTLRDATSRVVAFLLDRADEGPLVHLNTPKHVLASRLSIQPETLSRIFARLGKERLIKVERSDIALLDVAGLRKYLDVAL